MIGTNRIDGSIAPIGRRTRGRVQCERRPGRWSRLREPEHEVIQQASLADVVNGPRLGFTSIWQF